MLGLTILLVITAAFFIVFIAALIYKVSRDKIIKRNKTLCNFFIESQRKNTITILYLRNSSQDTTMFNPSEISQFFSFKINFEATIFRTFFKVGKFIALGQSGDFSYLGAERYYSENDNWKEKALQLMDDASMIIFKPYFTVALVWEFEQIIQKNYLHKTIIYLQSQDSGYNNYNDFRNSISDLIQFKLPKYSLFYRYIYFTEFKANYSVNIESIPLYKDLKRKSLKAGTYLSDSFLNQTVLGIIKKEKRNTALNNNNTDDKNAALLNFSEKDLQYLSIVLSIVIAIFVFYYVISNAYK